MPCRVVRLWWHYIGLLWLSLNATLHCGMVAKRWLCASTLGVAWLATKVGCELCVFFWTWFSLTKWILTYLYSSSLMKTCTKNKISSSQGDWDVTDHSREKHNFWICVFTVPTRSHTYFVKWKMKHVKDIKQQSHWEGNKLQMQALLCLNHVCRRLVHKCCLACIRLMDRYAHRLIRK